MALVQHFNYYLNFWYDILFKIRVKIDQLDEATQLIFPHKLAIDDGLHFLHFNFTPWVSQIYLALAAFNLASREENGFKKVFKSKIKVFGILLIFFFIENFIVAPNLGEALSFYPIMAWMIILTLISCAYNYFGLKGVLVLSALSLVHWVIPENSIINGAEELLQDYFHEDFEYDARVKYFLTSGCLGFLLGYIHYHKVEWAGRKDLILFCTGLVFLLVNYFWGLPFKINRLDIFETEHAYAKTILGSLHIWGAQLSVISAFLFMERKGWVLKLPLLNWVGVHSILVFSIHRVVFIHILAPLRFYVGIFFGQPLSNNIYDTFGYVLLTILIAWLIRASKIGQVLGVNADKSV
ncbi:MAG: hypothetical protein HOM21_03045 [Halobacteriovoraceae bacterium]|nr:hypothetical protein [Halobacteriovoraceae bacterium]